VGRLAGLVLVAARALLAVARSTAVVCFAPAELPAAEEDAVADKKEPPPAVLARPRRRGKRFVFPEGLTLRRIEYPLPPGEWACSCCYEPRVVIGQQITRQLELEPAQAYGVEHVRFTYACAKCRAGEQVETSAGPPLP